MKKIISIAVAGTMLAIGTGCAGMGYPAGSLYTGTTTPHGVNRNELSGAAKSGDKMGESCSTGILGLVAFGDASVDAAKKAGGVTEIHSVEFRAMSILGLYSQGCTVIHGK